MTDGWANPFDGSGGPLRVSVEPTLELMAGVYRLAATGGADSPRFRAYTEAAAERVPVHGYNPLTSKAVLPTIEALLAIDAERRLAEVATATFERIGAGGEYVLHLTVAAPGMWTDVLATEVEHRFLGHDPAGVLLWVDDLVTPAGVDSAVAAQAVRLAWIRRLGPADTLVGSALHEGSALAVAGDRGERSEEAAEVLDVLGADGTLSTMVAFHWGDNTARALGYRPLGLGDRAGSRHAIALAREAGW